MPTVPVSRENTVRNEALPGVRVNTDQPLSAFGGGDSLNTTNQAARGLNNEMSGAAFEVMAKQKKDADDVRLQAADLELSKAQTDVQIQANDMRGENAFGAPEFVDKEWKARSDKIREGLAGDYQKAQFNRIHAARSADLYRSTQNHVAAEAKQYDLDTTNAYVENAQNQAKLNYMDVGPEGQVEQSIYIQAQALARYGYRNGVPAPIMEQKIAANKSKTYAGVIEQMLNAHDGYAATEYLKMKKSEISLDDQEKITKMFEKSSVDLEDKLYSDFLDGTLTMEQVKAASFEKEQGGIGAKKADGLLNKMTQVQKAELRDITKDDEAATNYVDLVDQVVNDKVDNFRAKQVLVDAMADGAVDAKEAQRLHAINKNLNDTKFNSSSGFLNSATKTVKSWFGANNPDNKALASALKELIGSHSSEDPAAIKTAQNLINKANVQLYPELAQTEDGGIYDPERQADMKWYSGVERFGKGFGQGVAGSVEGFGGALKWLGADDVGKAVSNYAKDMQKFYAIPDPKFTDQLAAGIGSMGTFFIPGMGIAKSVQAATLFPRLAVWLGVGASTVLEATVEAGSAYERALNKSMPAKQAADAASKTFWINIPTIAITNKLGLFGESGGKFVRSLKASGFEGFQELSQSVISNMAVHDPVLQGAFESMAVGAIIGGGTKFTAEVTGAFNDLKTDKENLDKLNGNDIQIQTTPEQTQLLLGYEDSYQRMLRERSGMSNTVDVPTGEADMSGVAIPMGTDQKQESQKQIGYESDFEKVLRERSGMSNTVDVPTGTADFSGSAIPLADLYSRQNDIKNLIEWEINQQGGGAVVSGGTATGSERVVTYTKSGHSKAMQEIGPKESLDLLERAYNGEKLTELQQNKVDQLLEDYRENIKTQLVETEREIENATKDLSESEAAEVIDVFAEESQTTEYDWDGNIVGKKEEVKEPNAFGQIVNDVLRKLKEKRGSVVNPFQGKSKPEDFKTAEDYVASQAGIDIKFSDDTGNHEGFHNTWEGITINSKHKNNPKAISEILQHELVHQELRGVLGEYQMARIGQKTSLSGEQNKNLSELNRIYDQVKKSKIVDEKLRGAVDKGFEEFLSYSTSSGFLNKIEKIIPGVSSEIKERMTSLTPIKSQLTVEWEAAQKNKPETIRRSFLSKESGHIIIPDIPKIGFDQQTVKDFHEWVDAAFVPLSTRLAKISPKLRDSLRRFEFNKNMATTEDIKIIEPFLNRYSSMNPEEARILDLALKNSDKKTVNDIIARNGMTKEFGAVRDLLDDLYNQAREVGMDVGYIDDYFPRRVKDAQAYLEYLRAGEYWSQIEQAIKEEQVRIGELLTNDEKVEFINKLLRGYGNGSIKLNKPSNTKSRKIDVIDDNMNAFYKNSTTTLHEYVSAMNNAIESRKFFGMNGKDLDKSIGAYAKDLVDKQLISPTQEREVQKVIEARFKERGTHGIWTFYKNLGYIYTMGSPLSAVTQIGDLAFSFFESGMYSTGVGLQKSSSGKKITKADLGLDIIAEEFTDKSKSSEAVRKIFKIIGLEKLDNIGKETLVNGAMNKLSKQANANDPALIQELNRVFGLESAQTLQDLKNQNPSTNVKYLLFSKLADYQPIALSEMPEYYAKGGNMRIFYMLKSYSIKQIDVFHNKVFMEMKTNPKKALGNLIKLSAALAMMNGSADVIKNILLGRPTDLTDLVVDNILRLIGFSKYTVYKARREGIGAAMLATIFPPVPFVDDLYRDLSSKKDASDYKVWNAIPLVGKFYYWWFGGGRQFLDKKKKKSSF